MSNRLGGKQGTAYLGTNANQPPNMNYSDREPTAYDIQYSIGDFWVNSSAPDIDKLWVLMSLAGSSTSKGSEAHWIQVGTGSGTGLQTLTASGGGGAIPGDGANNINITAGSGISAVGNFATNTITISATNAGDLTTLTGDSGGAVSPVAGNINIVGGADLIVIGNPGTHTLTIENGGFLANEFETDNGNAVPVAGIVEILAQTASLGAGSSVSFSAPGSSNVVQLNVTDANSNTIIGKSAGKAGISGTNNTALGGFSASDLTSGSLNTLIGFGSGGSLLTGNENIAIGYASGASYTGAESGNIVIGSGGLTGESDTIRIGGAQTSAYMAGIFNTTGLTGALNVVVDSSGHLGVGEGTGSGEANSFVAYLTSTITFPTPSANADYIMGSSQSAFTTVFDNSAGFYPGNAAGSGAVWTAPATGVFVFNMYMLGQVVTLSDVPTNVPMAIVASNGLAYTSATAQAGIDMRPSFISNAVFNLTAGDTITFHVFDSPSYQGMVIQGGLNTWPGTGDPTYLSWVSGWQILGTSTAGLTAEPFFAYLENDSPNNIATGSEYVLGTDAILTVSYDESGGFYPGDGLGTPASFTAPTTGIYNIVFAGNYDVTVAGSAPFPFAAIMRIIATSNTFRNSINSTFLPGGTGVHNGDQYSAIVSMNAGDTVTFGFTITTGGGGFQAVMAGYTARGLNQMLTWVSGYKISN